MPSRDEIVKTTPRVEKQRMSSDAGLSIGVGEKGGLLFYGLGRFPIHLYFDQWLRLTKPEVAAEVAEFADTHSDKLAEKPIKVKANGKTAEGNAIEEKYLQVALKESERLAAAGDMQGAVRFATIAQVGKITGRVPEKDFLAVMQVKIAAEDAAGR